MRVRHIVTPLGLVFLTGTLLAGALPAVHAEVIKRIGPDGREITIILQKVPSAPRVGPCGEDPDDPKTFQAAQEAYTRVLQRLKAIPDNTDCRQQLVRLGRIE